MKFKVDNDYNIVSFARATWDSFPAPRKEFSIIVDDCIYFTSKRNLMSRCTSFGKIYDQRRERVTHKDFCDRHGLKIGKKFEITVITPLQTYRLKGTT